MYYEVVLLTDQYVNIPKIVIAKESLECVELYNYLGILIDNKLNFKQFVDDKFNKVNFKVY